MQFDMNTAGDREQGTVPDRPARRSSVRGRLGRLCLKELREILRDRRTTITLLLMPLLVYPLLSITFKRLMFSSADSTGPMQFQIGLRETGAEPPGDAGSRDSRLRRRLERYLSLGEVLLRRERAAEEATAGSGPPSGQAASPRKDRVPDIRWSAGGHLEKEVAAGTLDLAVLMEDHLRDQPVGDGPPPLHCQLIYRGNSTVSTSSSAFSER
jgi:hypothetical protein